MTTPNTRAQAALDAASAEAIDAFDTWRELLNNASTLPAVLSGAALRWYDAHNTWHACAAQVESTLADVPAGRWGV